jgi:hypothetical protein
VGVARERQARGASEPSETADGDARQPRARTLLTVAASAAMMMVPAGGYLA